VKIIANILDFFPGDESSDVFGELHVGSPARPAESCFGEGDSYVAGMLVYTETAGGVFTDVTSAAKSVEGSTFTFPGTAVNNAVYVATQVDDGNGVIPFYGIKTLIDTAGVLGDGNIIAEFWNGSVWVEFAGMAATDIGNRYNKAKDYFSEIGYFQLRYSADIITDGWVVGDPIVPALEIDYYWTRFRIVIDTITIAPIFQQFKIHTSKAELQEDGYKELTGRGRPFGSLPWNLGNAIPG